MNIVEFLRKTTVIKEIGNYEIQDRRPRLFCNDGFNMSVQAGEYPYCSPRRNGSEFYTVEIGYPSEREELLMEYCEDTESPTETVYGYVPIEVVQTVIDKHGGIKED